MAIETVTVACKFPNGYVLCAFDPVEDIENTPNGTRSVKRFRRRPGSDFKLNGVSHRQNMMPKSEIMNSFAITTGVPKDIWDNWYSYFKDTDAVRNGMIFAHGKVESVRAETSEKQKEKSGLERLDPNAKPAGIESLSRN